MKNWLLAIFASSTFNMCPHRPLPVMSGPPVEIHLKDDAVPRACHTPANVPLHWQKQVYEDLLRDEALGVIEKVPYGEPVEWCHRMVVTRKHDGTPRRTVDLSPLNKHCKREMFATESPFQVARRIPGKTWKTTTDAWNGYHSCALRESDRPLTTFITPFGRYRYLRAPQGFLSSGDGYNRRFDAILSDVQRKERVVDDLLHFDEDLETHWWRSIEILRTLGASGVVLNPDKFKFAEKEVDFAGFHITEDSVGPMSKFFDAILNFPSLKSTTDVRSWFGLVNQMAHNSQLRDLLAPFKKFLSPKCKFEWTDEYDAIFQASKSAIVEAIQEGVRIFETGRRTCLRPDFSARGIGYWLLQQHCSCSSRLPGCCQDGWRVTLAGSRFLSGAEQRYAPIEGEALAVAWGLEQSKYFTQGCDDLLVVTDHKPLVKVLGDRTLDEIHNTRLFRIKQRTLPWFFQIAHLPGKTNFAADATSRHPVPSADVALIGAFDREEPAVAASIRREAEAFTSITWQALAEATKADESMWTLLQAVERGMLDVGLRKDAAISQLWQYRDGLYALDGIILYDDRVVVPQSMQPQVLETLHSAHQGVSAMESAARAIVFWPGMSADISKTRANCKECAKNAPSQAAMPSTPATPPTTPFEAIFADYFDFAGHHYLAVGCRLSGWAELYSTPSGSLKSGSSGLTASLRSFFATFGVPLELASDGGPEFMAGATQEFLRRWGVKHRVSSAYHPQSNGRAEVAVKTAKRLLRSNVGPSGALDNDRLLRALLQLRNTPDPDCSVSPSQIVFGRHLRDTLSFASGLDKFSDPAVRPQWRQAWEAKEEALKARFVKSSESLNQHARLLAPLQIGQRVLVQNQHGNFPKRWDRTGTVVELMGHDQYRVKVDGSGRLTLRNRRFLRSFVPASPEFETVLPNGPVVAAPQLLTPPLVCDAPYVRPVPITTEPVGNDAPTDVPHDAALCEPTVDAQLPDGAPSVVPAPAAPPAPALSATPLPPAAPPTPDSGHCRPRRAPKPRILYGDWVHY